MTTIYTKSQALNVWDSQTGTDNLRVDMIAGDVAGSFESRIQHLNAAKEAQTVQFPGPLAFYDESNVRYVLADRFTAVDATAAANAAAARTRGEFNTNRTGAHIQSSFDDRAIIVASVTAENGRATSAESALATDLAQEVQDRGSAITSLGNDLGNEVTARKAADTVNANAIITAEGKVAAEATTARAAEVVNADAITAEASTARTAEAKAASELFAEVRTRSDEDTRLQGDINTLNTTTTNLANSVPVDIAAAVLAENTRATTEEGKLQSQITNLLNASPEQLDSLTELVTD